MKFDNKIALVTGGASGIGKATVMEFARSGAIVICLRTLTEKRHRGLVNEARQSNFSVEYLPDRSGRDSTSIRRSAASILTRHPRIDILVNAAGWNDIQPFVDNPPDYMERALRSISMAFCT